jgi:hypothetical protein
VAGGKLLRHKEEGENGEEWLGPKLDDLPMALTMKGVKCSDSGTKFGNGYGALTPRSFKMGSSGWYGTGSVDNRPGASENKWGKVGVPAVIFCTKWRKGKMERGPGRCGMGRKRGGGVRPTCAR